MFFSSLSPSLFSSFFLITVKTLEEESQYTFEVAAMSLSDDEATSERISLEVPAYRRNRAISMGIVAGIGFLAATLAAVWWARKRFCRTSTNEKWKLINETTLPHRFWSWDRQCEHVTWKRHAFIVSSNRILLSQLSRVKFGRRKKI